MTPLRKKNLERFGFSFERGGAHTARTMMMEELSLLFDYVVDKDAAKKEYVKAIVDDNCLGKRSVTTRKLTKRHLIDLYALDPSITIFRALRYFWQRDEEGRPIMALVCAFARDPILRISAPFIFFRQEGENVTRIMLEEYIEKQEPGRFSKATLESTAQNINATWTKAGHLKGGLKKFRSQARPGPGSVAYALLMGYITGYRGISLFETDYTKLLDCSMERAMELADFASRRGWIVFKRIENVIEVSFPNLITKQEMEWIHEQVEETY